MSHLFTRSKINPILRPGEGNPWWKVYNPGAIVDKDGKTHLFPRVMKKEKNWHSSIAHAVSKDGENFTWDENVPFIRNGASEKRGLEDPRITLIGDTYYMVFAAYDGKTVLLHSASTKNLNGPWTRHGVMLPDFDFFKNGGKIFKWEGGKPIEKTTTKRGRTWNKSGALFPERIDSKLVMIFGEYTMWLAYSIDGISWEADPKPILAPRPGTSYFDNTFIETGPPPILTEKGWLVLYHGIDEAFRYQLGFVILDKADPRKILFRTDEPIFGPKESYEIGDMLIDVISGGIDAMKKMSDAQLKEHYKKAREKNVMPQVTFCCGTTLKDGILRIYYGAGDTSICMAEAKTQELLDLVG